MRSTLAIAFHSVTLLITVRLSSEPVDFTDARSTADSQARAASWIPVARLKYRHVAFPTVAPRKISFARSFRVKARFVLNRPIKLHHSFRISCVSLCREHTGTLLSSVQWSKGTRMNTWRRVNAVCWSGWVWLTLGTHDEELMTHTFRTRVLSPFLSPVPFPRPFSTSALKWQLEGRMDGPGPLISWLPVTFLSFGEFHPYLLNTQWQSKSMTKLIAINLRLFCSPSSSPPASCGKGRLIDHVRFCSHLSVSEWNMAEGATKTN